MAEMKAVDVDALRERLAAFLASQQQILSEFQRSLANARHFVELANLSMEKEPENTVTMLKQLQDIGLADHLETQFENFEAMERNLPLVSRMEETATQEGEWEDVRTKYGELLEEAARQTKETEFLLHATEGNA